MRAALLTRSLPVDSPLYTRAAAAGYHLHALPFLRAATLPFAYPRDPDWLFAYSANAVRGFVAQAGAREWARARRGLRIGAIGAGTAAAWRAQEFAVDFEGGGTPAEVAMQFVRVAAGQRVGFLQAAESRDSVARLLGPEIAATPVVTYETTPVAPGRLPEVDVALLTSPKCAAGFLAAYAKTYGAEALGRVRLHVIGETTAAAVAELGREVAAVAGEASIEGVVGTLGPPFDA